MYVNKAGVILAQHTYWKQGEPGGLAPSTGNKIHPPAPLNPLKFDTHIPNSLHIHCILVFNAQNMAQKVITRPFFSMFLTLAAEV